MTMPRKQLVLTPDQEAVRCAVCGLGAREGSWDETPARHVRTIVLTNGASCETLTGIDHEPVPDNIGPDGRVYPFGRIVATEHIGPYAVTRTENVTVDGDVEVSYSGYVQTQDGEMRRTGHSHLSLDECLIFNVAYAKVGANTAQHLVPFFMRGLED